MAKYLVSKIGTLTVNNDQDQYINVLLLGEAGVGKSTFINAFANYFQFKTFESVAKANVVVPIPSRIIVTDKKGETVQIGSDENEVHETDGPKTQRVKTYVFPIAQTAHKLRLIDTPPIGGDPRGIGQDDINCKSIFAYLLQLKQLHAICFLMKSAHTGFSGLFEYCVREILSVLEKSAAENIIFIFTNTRPGIYTPGEALTRLKRIIDDINAKYPDVKIPITKGNIFSLDNEAFELAVAMQFAVQFEEGLIQSCKESWNVSLDECRRLIKYIIGEDSRQRLEPHQMQKTTIVNETRRLIFILSQILPEISQLMGNDQLIEELDHEYRIIIDTRAKCANFLRHNAILLFDDSHKNCIEHLIERESLDEKMMDNLRNLLKKNDELNELKNFDNKDTFKTPQVTSTDIKNAAQELYCLKNFGEKIKQLFDMENTSSIWKCDTRDEYVSEPININSLGNTTENSKNNNNQNASTSVDRTFRNEDRTFSNRQPQPSHNYSPAPPPIYTNRPPYDPQNRQNWSLPSGNYGPPQNSFNDRPQRPFNERPQDQYLRSQPQSWVQNYPPHPYDQYYPPPPNRYNEPQRDQYYRNIPQQPSNYPNYGPPQNQYQRQFPDPQYRPSQNQNQQLSHNQNYEQPPYRDYYGPPQNQPPR